VNWLTTFLPFQNETWARSRKRCFRGSTGPANAFSAFRPSQNTTCERSNSYVSNGRLVLKSLFLSPGRHKIQLGRGRESDVSRGQVALRTHFLPYWDIGDVENAVFQEVDWPCEHISRLQAVINSTLARSRKECFKESPGLPNLFSNPGRSKLRDDNGRESVLSRCQLALRTNFLTSVPPKWDLSEAEKAMIQGVGLSCELIFCLLEVPKFDLGEVEKAMFQGVNCNCEFIFQLLAVAKCDLGRSRRRCFKESIGLSKSFSAFWHTENSTWARSKKRCFTKGRLVMQNHFLSYGRRKMRFWWCQERNDVSLLMNLRINFLHFESPKMLHWRCLESYVSRERPALPSHFLPSSRQISNVSTYRLALGTL
jgi:hypothetical protein